MQAIQYNRPGKVAIIDLPVPKPAENEVLIAVEYAGICGTDIHIMAEESPAASQVVLGHEFSGKIVSLGKNVMHMKVDDNVSVDPNNYCGWCEYCQKGQVHFCKNLKPIGIFRDGAWAQYCLAPISQVFSLLADIPLSWGALCEPLSCILHGWDRLQPLGENSKIMIMGCGLLGVLWGLTLEEFGYNNLIFIEPVANRRKIAEGLGFSTISSRSLLKKINTDQKDFDLIIDCSGNPEAINGAFNLLNPFGKFLFFGVCPERSQIKLEAFQIFKKELTLIGSVVNPFTFSRAICLVSKIHKPIEMLGVNFFSLDEYQQAIQEAKSGEILKSMFTPNKNFGSSKLES